MSNKTKHFVIVGVLIVVTTFLLRLIFGYMFRLPYAEGAELSHWLLHYLGFNMPAPASAEAAPIDGMFNAHYWIISFLFALIMVLVLYAVVVFRRQPDDDTDGPHIHSHTGLEVMWTVIPTIVVIGFGVYGAVVLNDITAPSDNEMVVRVESRQWSWSFSYPEHQDVRSAMLVLPVNQPVLLELESEDVIHSFWVPEFRVKQDLVPGRTTFLRLTPTEKGDFRLLCAEICGTGHADMRAQVRVVDQAEFEQFIQDSMFRFSDLTPEERGELWSTDFYGCTACHSLDGAPGVGPSWLGLFMNERPLDDGTTVIADEAYIRESILLPNAEIVAGFAPDVMPQDYEQRFEAQQAEILAAEGVEIDIIDDIIAFIKTLEE